MCKELLSDRGVQTVSLPYNRCWMWRYNKETHGQGTDHKNHSQCKYVGQSFIDRLNCKYM